MTHITLTRRSLLLGTLATPLLAGMGMAQGRTGRLPPWVQWNRTKGRAWQTRTVTTVRAYPAQGTLISFQWKQGPTSPVHLRTYTNAAEDIEKLFRAYEARPAEDLAENPEAIEDFSWVLGNRLRENIWTSFHPAAENTWDAIFAREDFEETVLPPGSGYYLLLQPTMDKVPNLEETPDAEVLDLAGVDAATPLAKIVEAMLAQGLFITLVPQTVIPKLSGEVLAGTKSVMARIAPRTELAVGAAYVRFIRQGN